MGGIIEGRRGGGKNTRYASDIEMKIFAKQFPEKRAKERERERE